MGSAIDGYFMSIVPLGSESKSFEELRIDDYIKAYQSTGRPPQPCPQEPVDESQRMSLNLPPLFKPHPIRNSNSTTTSLLPFGTGRIDNPADISLVSAARVENPAELPPGQEFRSPLINGEKYQCISCMPEYTHFNQEELRYYAYLAGNIKPPASVKMDPFVPTARQGLVASPLTNTEDQFQSISAQPQYNKHSHEELRVTFLLYGREMTSDEILRLQNPSATSTVVPPPPPSSSTQPIIVTPTPSVFAAPTSVPPLSKFTFGL